MGLSKRSIQTLLDLIEIKLSCMQVYDREDARELAVLENCRRELMAIAAGGENGTVVPFQAGERRPGRAKRESTEL